MVLQFNDETWEAMEALARDNDKRFQELADEAFDDLLKRYRRPVGLKASLKENIAAKPTRKGK